MATRWCLGLDNRGMTAKKKFKEIDPKFFFLFFFLKCSSHLTAPELKCIGSCASTESSCISIQRCHLSLTL